MPAQTIYHHEDKNFFTCSVIASDTCGIRSCHYLRPCALSQCYHGDRHLWPRLRSVGFIFDVGVGVTPGRGLHYGAAARPLRVASLVPVPRAKGLVLSPWNFADRLLLYKEKNAAW